MDKEIRITTIADVYDALRNERVYKPPFDHGSACRIIIDDDGRTILHHFNPEVLEAFRSTVSQFEKTYERLKG